MSYPVRNSLILGVLWLMILSGGMHWIYGHNAGEVKRLRLEEEKKHKRLGDLNVFTSAYDEIQEKYMKTEERWSRRAKVIPSEDDPAHTFAYLNDILSHRGAFLSFDFVFERRMDKGDFSYNSYTLSGEGDFRKLYNFIWYLENKRPLYKITALNVEEYRVKEEKKVRSRVKFTMAIDAYFSPKSELGNAVSMDGLRPRRLSTNPFLPLIHEEAPKNTAGLFEVEGAKLRAVGHNRAFLEDRNRRLHTLKEGDKVFTGSVTAIRPERGEVEFTLNRVGILEKVFLEIPFGRDKKE